MSVPGILTMAAALAVASTEDVKIMLQDATLDITQVQVPETEFDWCEALRTDHEHTLGVYGNAVAEVRWLDRMPDSPPGAVEFWGQTAEEWGLKLAGCVVQFADGIDEHREEMERLVRERPNPSLSERDGRQELIALAQDAERLFARLKLHGPAVAEARRIVAADAALGDASASPSIQMEV